MILWMDGFDWIKPPLGTTECSYALLNRYANVTYARAVDGRCGGTGIGFSSYSQSIQTPVLQGMATANHCYVGYAVKTGSSFFGSDSVLQVFAYNDWNCYARFRPNGDTAECNIYPGMGAVWTDIGIKANRWYYLEWHFLVQSSGGAYELRVNGETVLEATGVDMAYRSWDGWSSIKLFSHGYDCVLDDLYVLNGSGSVNNDFLGDVRIVTKKPDSTLTSNWTPHGESENHAALVDVPIEPLTSRKWTETGYVEASVTDTDDFYGFEDLSDEFAYGTIHAIQLQTVSRVTNPQMMTLKMICLQTGGEDVVDTTKLMWDDYGLETSLVETNPDTSNLWTHTDLNAAEFGVEVG